MHFIIIVDPWESEPVGVVGPFKDYNETKDAWDELLKLGANPDCFGKIVELTDMNEARKRPPYAFEEGLACLSCGKTYEKGHAPGCDYNDEEV